MAEYANLVSPQDMSQMTNTLGMGSGVGLLGMAQDPLARFQGLQNLQQNSVAQQMNAPMQAINAIRDEMKQMDVYKLGANALQGFAKPQQQAQNPIQIVRDQNQFRFAGNPQQQMANALRKY